jgi:hypothetical protein
MAIFIGMATFKIKREDKIAFINKLEKLGVRVSTTNMEDGESTNSKGKTIKWSTFEVPNPEHAKKVKDMLHQSPAINVIKEMIRKELKKYLEG